VTANGVVLRSGQQFTITSYIGMTANMSAAQLAGGYFKAAGSSTGYINLPTTASLFAYTNVASFDLIVDNRLSGSVVYLNSNDILVRDGVFRINPATCVLYRVHVIDMNTVFMSRIFDF